MGTTEHLATLEPGFRIKIESLIAAAAGEGIRLCVTSGRRTINQQNVIFAQGRTAPGKIVTNAKGGQSPHNFGLAADFCPLNAAGELWWNAPESMWQRIGSLAKARGLVWGGDFKSIKDRPHVEDPGWKTVQAAWKRGDIQVA
jgi:peptidoglycan L-alanyl-D-glutamate endopeptidase CwlK